MRSAVMGEEMYRVLPVIEEDGSDSQMLDNTLEFLTMNGIPLSLAGMILLPEPWQGIEDRETILGLMNVYRYMKPEDQRHGSYVIVSDDYGFTWSDPIRVPCAQQHSGRTHCR